MRTDLQQADLPASVLCDVCIVGAGAAGIVLAQELAKAGLEVVLLESGGVLRAGPADALNEGELGEGAHGFSGFVEGRARALGGATRLWYGQCIRLDEIDFEARPGLPWTGWPVAAADLTPYYERAESFFGMAGQAYDESVYRQFGIVPPAWDQLRSHFTAYTPLVDLGAHFEEELQRSERIHLLLHATATSILTNETGSEATGVRFCAPDGRRHEVRARSVVVCGGGIENARLLLLSSEAKPEGLGNDRDLVGRFFQDHPNGQTATITTTDVERLSSLFGLLYRRKLRFFPKFAIAPARQAKDGLLNGNAHLVFEYGDNTGIAAGKRLARALRRGDRPPHLAADLAHLLGDLPETVRAGARLALRGRSPVGRPTRIRLQCYLEQQPDAGNRIQLGETRDSLGLRRARLTWSIGSAERRTLRALTHTVQAEFDRLRLGQVVPDTWLDQTDVDLRSHLNDAFHHAGTTRMASDASEGVVDRNAEVFGTAGLYLAGSSVFPTSGYANPTLSIVALTMRLADHLLLKLAA